MNNDDDNPFYNLYQSYLVDGGDPAASDQNAATPASPSSGAPNPAKDSDLVSGILGKIWDLPNTALGLGLGVADSLATLATGQVPHIGFGNGALQISNLLDLRPINLGGAITFGDTQLYNGVKPGDPQEATPYIQPDGSRLNGFTYGEHERAHTAVDDRLGIFALPLYLGSALTHGWYTNPYEQKADQNAAYGTSPFP